jgi:hypothetical protein
MPRVVHVQVATPEIAVQTGGRFRRPDQFGQSLHERIAHPGPAGGCGPAVDGQPKLGFEAPRCVELSPGGTRGVRLWQ